MKKQVLTEEINRVLELMKVDKKIISEATVAPGGLLARLLGDAVDFVASKIGAEAFESLEAKFAANIERIGRTFETATEKEIGTILKNVEYAGLRKAAGESIAKQQQQLIDDVIRKYAIEVGGKKTLTLEGGKAVTKELVEAGIYRPFLQDIRASWKANGGWSRIEGKAVDNAADDAAKLAADDLAKKAEQEAAERAAREAAEKEAAERAAREAAEKAAKEAEQALNMVEQQIEELFPGIKNNEALKEKITSEVAEKIKGKGVSEQLSIMLKELGEMEATLQQAIEQAEKTGNKESVKKLTKFGKILSGLKMTLKKLGIIGLDKKGVPVGGFKGILRLVGMTWFYETIFFGLIGFIFTKKGLALSFADAATFYQWNRMAEKFEKWLNEKTNGGTNQPPTPPNPNPNPAPAPVAGAKYANNIDGFKQYCKDEGIDATNAISLSGSIYKTNTTSGIEYKFKELDATSKLGTFE